MNTLEWRPDTCNCNIQLQIENNIYTAIESVTDRFDTTYNRIMCNRHTHITNLQDHYQTVLDENRRKNQVYEDILQITPDTPQKFSINEVTGMLTFTVTPFLTASQISEIQTNYLDVVFI